jgi:hypothetical protein
MSIEPKIDFVIPWVDGNDEIWKSEKNKYIKKQTLNSDCSEKRFRDWENLRYWFRGVEKFAPWVNKVYFITYGHIPDWLNIKHSKLKIIKHKDFIPKKYLPTFSSHVIELNLHRIKDLEEKFVYFNDDLFLINNTLPKDFFYKGLPCDSAILKILNYDPSHLFVMSPYRNTGIINKYFSKKQIFKNIFKWLNFKYGYRNLLTLYLLFWPKIPGLRQQHLANSFCKNTYEELWKKEENLLNETCTHKFREISDVNQWLFKDYQIISGNFYPRSLKIGKSFTLSKNDYMLSYNYIVEQKGKMICMNDTELSDNDFEIIKEKIKEAFFKILPEKSSFEK